MRADGGCGCGGKPRARAWTELRAEAPRAEDLRADGVPGFRCAGVPRPRQRPPAEPTGCGCEAAVEAPAAPEAARPRGGIGQIRPRDDDDDRVVHFGRTSRSAFRRAARHTAALYGAAPPPRWKDAPVSLGAATQRGSPAKMLAAAAAWKKKVKVATRGGPEGSDPLGEFTVCIGDAKFVVPASFYYSGEYREVLPTEDDALEYIWPIQTLYRATKGLTGEQVDELWGCIDLKPDEGWFFKEVDSNGIGGYAGRTFYWATQYLAMFWEFTREGEVVDGKESPCKGIADARDVLLADGLKVPRWHVLGSGDGVAGQMFYGYPDRQHCLSTVQLGALELQACSDIVWDDGSGADPVLNNSNDYELTFRTTHGGVARVERRIDSAGTDTEQVLYYGAELRADRADEDPGGGFGAYVPDVQDCHLVAKARTPGYVGLSIDAYLHWAHVAAALAVSCESFAAVHYLECALLLGRYAANEVVGYAKLIAHELAHRYTEGISHFDGDCCMCTIAESWASGVRALLGLPDSSDAAEYTGDDQLLAYPTFVLQRDVGCSNDGSTTPLFSWYTWYATPGESYGSRGFAAFDAGSKRVRATMAVPHS